MRWPRPQRTGSRPRLRARARSPSLPATSSRGRPARLAARGHCAAGSRSRLPPISPRRRGSSVAIDYNSPGTGPGFRSVCGAVRRRPPSHDRRRTRTARGRAALAGAPAGAGDARPCRFLARQLCRSQSRDEGPLSAPSLAGRSARRRCHAARQAAFAMTQRANQPSLRAWSLDARTRQARVRAMKSSLALAAGAGTAHAGGGLCR